jgi:hypothetical protein
MTRKDEKMTDQTLVRYTPSLGKVLDQWRMSQLDTPSRADALRRLAALALKDLGYKLPVPEKPEPGKAEPKTKGRKA